jgi:hypothetical protein
MSPTAQTPSTFPFAKTTQYQFLRQRTREIGRQHCFTRRRDQRAVCFASPGCPSLVGLATTPVPLRKSARSSRAGIRLMPQLQQASVCGPAAGRSAPAPFHKTLLSALRSTFPARRPQTEASSKTAKSGSLFLCYSTATNENEFCPNPH